jgi:hypothetical protein
LREEANWPQMITKKKLIVNYSKNTYWLHLRLQSTPSEGNIWSCEQKNLVKRFV